MQIRPASPADLEGITRLFFSTVNNVNAKDYSPEHIQAWAEAAFDQEFWLDKISSLHFWVADTEDSELLGFISLTSEAFVSQPTYIVRSNKTDKNKTRY
jgi:putative acetyltransferase